MKNYIIAFTFIILSYFQVTSAVKFILFNSLTPTIYFYKSAAFEIKDFFIFYSNVEGIRRENFNLKNRVRELELASSVSKIEKSNLEELERTKNLFINDSLFENSKISYSRVLFYNPSFSKLLLTNNDTNAKINSGNLVLFGRNLIGVVSNVSASLLEVKLISAKDFDLNTVIVTRGGDKVKTVTSGDKFDGLVINNLLSTEQVGDEDLVITSSTNEGILSDLIIGRLDRIEGISSQTFRKAYIKKFYDLNYIEYVGVLTND